MSLLSHNKRLFKLQAFVQGFADMFAPFLFLFYLSIGFSTKQIGILAATVFAVVLLSEISSGIFSDLYGRRNALVVSSSFFVIFLIFHLFFTSFPLLLLGSVFLGLGRSFYSGSFDALI